MSTDQQLHLYLLAAPRRPWRRASEISLEILLGSSLPRQLDRSGAVDSPSAPAVTAGVA